MPRRDDLYSGGAAPYLSLMYPAAASPDRLRFLTSVLRGADRFVDIGAGDGTLALSLARAGHRVTAVEPDSEMRTILTTRLAACPDLVSKVTVAATADALVRVGASYPVVSCQFVLHHMDEQEERLSLLRSLSTLCEPGGFVVVEEPTAASARSAQGKKIVKEQQVGDSMLVHTSERYPLDRDTWITEWRFQTLIQGRVIDEAEQKFCWKAYTSDRLTAEARAVGLQVHALYRDFDNNPFRPGVDQSVVMVLGR